MDHRWARQRMQETIADNQWLFPAVGAVLGMALAQVVGTSSENESSQWTIPVDRGRDWLIASLGMTFTALSIVLALASMAAQNVVGRFGSRTLRIYIRHSVQRWIVGAFAFTTSFILAEQFQLRKLDSENPVPEAPLIVSVLLLVAMGSLVIWYISHVVRWFRVDQAVGSVDRKSVV